MKKKEQNTATTIRRRLFLSDISKEGALPSVWTTLMVQQNKPLAIPKTVQKWIVHNVPALKSGTKLGFSKPQHGSVNYVSASWHVTLHVLSLAKSIYFHPGRYPKSVRNFVSQLPRTENVYLVIRRGRVGTEMENWRGFAPKRG